MKVMRDESILNLSFEKIKKNDLLLTHDGTTVVAAENAHMSTCAGCDELMFGDPKGECWFAEDFI